MNYFTCLEDVKHYLSGDKVECLECGGYFSGLGSHTVIAHGITASEYKAKYGIPQSYGLVGSSLRDRHSENAFRLHNENPQIAEKLRVIGIEKTAYNTNPPYSLNAPVDGHLANQRGKAARGSRTLTKIPKEEYAEIIRLQGQGLKTKDIALRFGVSANTISRILLINGKSTGRYKFSAVDRYSAIIARKTKES